MPHDHRYTFSFGRRYRASRELSFGFTERQLLPSGAEFEFREVKYSRYDGSYAYHFRPVSSSEILELWVHEDTLPSEVTSWFVAV
jgi:hypothetical protein